MPLYGQGALGFWLAEFLLDGSQRSSLLPVDLSRYRGFLWQPSDAYGGFEAKLAELAWIPFLRWLLLTDAARPSNSCLLRTQLVLVAFTLWVIPSFAYRYHCATKISGAPILATHLWE